MKSGAAERVPSGGSIPRPRSGFTIIEVIVVLAVVAALVGVLAPLGFQFLESRREDATREQMLAIKRAIVGNAALREAGGPRLLESEQRDFGFNGDLGGLPDSLPQLLMQGNQPAFQVDSASGLAAGWRGPYLERQNPAEADDVFRDAFGRPLLYARKDTTADDGTEWVGFIRSGGADRSLGTPDDVIVPILPEEVRGRATGFLRHGTGQPINDASVTYAFRDGGTVSDTLLTTDSLGAWTGPLHSYGGAVVTAGAAGEPSLGYVRNLARVFGTNHNNAEFRVVNVTQSDVTISSLTASWPAGATDGCYRDAWFAGVDVSGTGPNIKCSGETLNFTQAITLQGGGTFGASTARRRLSVDRPSILAPELSIQGGDRRGGALVQLLDWEDGGSGPDVDIRGLQLTVQFSDGMSTTFTLPSN